MDVKHDRIESGTFPFVSCLEKPGVFGEREYLSSVFSTVDIAKVLYTSEAKHFLLFFGEERINMAAPSEAQVQRVKKVTKKSTSFEEILIEQPNETCR